MKICRYNENKLGLVNQGQVYDVTDALNELPTLRWPVPLGDCLVEHLEMLRPVIMKLAENTISIPLKQVKLRSPVANPSKIIGAPINYQTHVDESKASGSALLQVEWRINEVVCESKAFTI